MKRFILLILLLVGFRFAQANDSLKIESLKLRIERLEEFKEIRDQKTSNQIDLIKERNEIQIERAKQELMDEIRPMKWAIGAISILAFLSLGAFIYQIVVGIKKIAEKQLKKNLQRHLKDNSETILSLIKTQKVDDRLKYKKKIVTLSSTEVSSQKITQSLNRMGFKDVSGLVIDKYKRIKDADLIIFNNAAKDFNSDLIFEYLKKSKEEDLFVCFYPDYMKIPDDLATERDRVNFANKNYTLYHQIMQTLIFQELLEDID